MTTHNINKKRLIIRLSLVALLILLCFVLFYTGKEHEVLLDNKTATIGGREYQEIAYMNGWITKEDILNVYEILKKNQYGQYLKDILDGKFLDVRHK